eukprot:scaffold991_cov227-Pinguiococcus_pyrenoidosus.AAC.2
MLFSPTSRLSFAGQGYCSCWKELEKKTGAGGVDCGSGAQACGGVQRLRGTSPGLWSCCGAGSTLALTRGSSSSAAETTEGALR